MGGVDGQGKGNKGERGVHGKGGGKGAKGFTREVGSFAHLKNFRKGLAHQRERCERE